MTRINIIAVATTVAAAVLAMTPPTAQADPAGDFTSPTGDVYCQMYTIDGSASVVCEGGGPYTGPAPDCPHGNYGDRFSLQQGLAPTVECHTDTIRSNQAQAPILFYGQTQTVGDITCDSELSGITCTDTSTGRFFSMSAAANTLG